MLQGADTRIKNPVQIHRDAVLVEYGGGLRHAGRAEGATRKQETAQPRYDAAVAVSGRLDLAIHC